MARHGKCNHVMRGSIHVFNTHAIKNTQVANMVELDICQQKIWVGLLAKTRTYIQTMSTLEIKKKAITLRDIPAKNFIDTYAQYLKKSGKVKIPKWIDFVKNGVTNELPPTNPDWYYIRLGMRKKNTFFLTCMLISIHCKTHLFETLWCWCSP